MVCYDEVWHLVLCSANLLEQSLSRFGFRSGRSALLSIIARTGVARRYKVSLLISFGRDSSKRVYTIWYTDSVDMIASITCL